MQRVRLRTADPKQQTTDRILDAGRCGTEYAGVGECMSGKHRSFASRLLPLRVLASRIGKSRFFTAGKHGLHTARFAYLHELASLHITTDNPTTQLPIGRGEAGSVLGLTPKPNRPELGNVAIFAPTRGGKG